jgi:hypothetical protein
LSHYWPGFFFDLAFPIFTLQIAVGEQNARQKKRRKKEKKPAHNGIGPEGSIQLPRCEGVAHRHSEPYI